MLHITIVAGFLATCLTAFVAVNVCSLLKRARARRDNATAEVEMAHTPAFALVALGTGAFFVLSVLYIVLAAAGSNLHVAAGLLQLTFPLDSWVQFAGMVMTGIGYAVFLWSVLARGKYATSWEMPSDQKLVTWGPYRHVRHPSYLAYFILFAGLLLLLLNLVALIPFVATPGYVRITGLEDEMLRRRFGDAARDYQKVTGTFLPRRKRRE